MDDVKRGRVLKSRYRIERVLGQGAMGAVYLARDLDLTGALWAVKVLTVAGLPAGEATEAVTLFQREVDLLSRLRHPGLPGVVDAFREGDDHLLVMELIQGQTLDALMDSRARAFTEAELVPWLQQLASCLAYLHEQKPHPVIFRDLKPSNCMVTGDGRLQLIDFGIARHYKPGRKTDTIVLGTPGFCAPEQYGTAQTDPRSDLYSLGAMAWHLLSGADPAAVGFNYPPLRQVAPACSSIMEEIVARCVAFNPEERYPSARELLADLQYADSPQAARHEREARTRQRLGPHAMAPGRSPSPSVGAPTRRMASVSATHLGPAALGAAAGSAAASPFAPVRPGGFEPKPAPGPLPVGAEGAFLRSWLARTFQVWWGPGSIYFPRILALMLLTFCLLPFITIWAQTGAARDGAGVHSAEAELGQCVRNLQVIRGRLEAYRQQHGRYPARLAEILPLSSESVAGGLDIYAYGYLVTDHGRHCVVTCEGHSYAAAGLPPNYPRLVDHRILREPEERP